MQLAVIAALPHSGKLTMAQSDAIFMAQNFPDIMSIDFDMDIKLKREASQLAKAAERGDTERVEAMLDTGVKPDPVALYLAANDGRSSVVAALADSMDDIDTDVGWSGNALCAAACHPHGYDTIKVLLEKGADINHQGGKYGCALQAAAAGYVLNNVQLLLRCGADVNAQCGHYGNVLTAVARHNTHFEEMTMLLLQHGADINAEGPGAYGNPLQTAVYLKHVNSVKFLLAQGASTSCPGKFGSAMDIVQGGAFRYKSSSGIDEEERMIKFLLNEDKCTGFIEDEELQ
jgi:ankyrin repeat protein